MDVVTQSSLHGKDAETGPDAVEDGIIDRRYAEDIVWLGRRLKTATGCKGAFGRRDRANVRGRFGPGGDLRQAASGALVDLFRALELKVGRWRREPAEDLLPMVALLPDAGYRLVYARSSDGIWLVEGSSGRETIASWPEGCSFMAVALPPEIAEENTARGMFRAIFASRRSWVFQSALASTLASILVLATSLYSMQVYDRVIAYGGIPTLVVLTVGVMIAILTELLMKLARSVIVNRAIQRIDVACANGVFARLLGIRFDRFPASVGTLSAQVRGFETVRGFTVSLWLYITTDAPFALFFLGVILLLGGPQVALVPAIAFVIAVSVGLAFRRAISRHSLNETLVGNRRQGLLVEAIQGIESLKSTGGSWYMAGRWNDLSRRTADETTEIKKLNDLAGYFAALIQQISYVGLVATGAWLAATENTLTVGAIIACSIVSGRVLTPVNMIPGLLVQWAHAKVALENLEKLFALERECNDVEVPLSPERIDGRIAVEKAEFGWPGQAVPLTISWLKIDAGERVAILGSVGTGKSTLLRMLAGLACPERGQVLIDGIDLQQIAPERRAEIIGYLPQNTRLLGGTLRENLGLGLPFVAEDKLLSCVAATGLDKLVASRPEGLDLKIAEGGEGLSGGQKQLVGLTRLLLAEPTLWLLDEPTSSMDDATEEQCIAALRRAVKPGQTMVLVTHKLRLLELVDRIVVLGGQGIALDGPRDAVIARLREGKSASKGEADSTSAPEGSKSEDIDRAPGPVLYTVKSRPSDDAGTSSRSDELSSGTATGLNSGGETK